MKVLINYNYCSEAFQQQHFCHLSFYVCVCLCKADDKWAQQILGELAEERIMGI